MPHDRSLSSKNWNPWHWLALCVLVRYVVVAAAAACCTMACQLCTSQEECWARGYIHSLGYWSTYEISHPSERPCRSSYSFCSQYAVHCGQRSGSRSPVYHITQRLQILPSHGTGHISICPSNVRTLLDRTCSCSIPLHSSYARVLYSCTILQWQSHSWPTETKRSRKELLPAIPVKIKVILWLMLKNTIVLTKDNLLRRGWHGDAGCQFCGQHETADHLSVRCSLQS